jgi:hypothetical protein
MKNKELNSPYYMFGNKGDVWGDRCHISKGGDSVTLCGIPMLSTNWARIEKVEKIGCKTCVDKYLFNDKTKK